MSLRCFKAYDIRGKLDEDLNEKLAYNIGRAYAQHLQPRKIVLGADIRHSSEPLKQALAKGLLDAGVDVIDIGMTGTEEIYFASFHLDVDGGIEVTASHNPIDYNGMKLVRKNAVPISGDSGLNEIERLVELDNFPAPGCESGKLLRASVLDEYIDHLLGYIDTACLRPLRLVTNAGNGAAGHVIDAIEASFNRLCIPIEFIKINNEPDGNFPNGIPNPLLPENRPVTAEAVINNQADIGIAWDGDFDRCFLFDEKGQFIEGYYIVGLLAKAFLDKHPGEKIIHDPRLVWNTVDIVENNDGTAVQSKTGHAFIKERMRKENAIYGGEMSAHHYFRDFAYCDSGMIPWLLVIELLSRSGQTLSSLVKQRIGNFPCSGEINFKVEDSKSILEKIRQNFLSASPVEDYTDGMTLEFDDWRFNVRTSNTEPLLRLNVETRKDRKLMEEKTTLLSSLITATS